jgi:hypothetical protein
MRKPLALSAAVVLAAAGFAGASIASGGSFAALGHVLTGTIGATTTISTTSTTGGRTVVLCHRHGGKHHWFKTIAVDQHALRGHLRHGDHVGACTGVEGAKPKGGEAASAPDNHGQVSSHGKSGDDDDNDPGKSVSQGGGSGQGTISGLSASQGNSHKDDNEGSNGKGNGKDATSGQGSSHGHEGH